MIELNAALKVIKCCHATAIYYQIDKLHPSRIYIQSHTHTHTACRLDSGNCTDGVHKNHGAESHRIVPSTLACSCPIWNAHINFCICVADGGRWASVAKGCSRPELWLHVQAPRDRQQLRRQDQLPVPVRWWFLHLSLRVHSWNRFQGQNRVPSRQKSQAPNLGEYIRKSPALAVTHSNHGGGFILWGYFEEFP